MNNTRIPQDRKNPATSEFGYRYELIKSDAEIDTAYYHCIGPGNQRYTLNVENGAVSFCSCPSFAHRTTCKHQDALGQLLFPESLPVAAPAPEPEKPPVLVRKDGLVIDQATGSITLATIPPPAASNVVGLTADLVSVRDVNIVELFQPGGTEPLLELAKSEVEKLAEHFDIATPFGRECITNAAKKIKSFSNKVDGIGKDYVADMKKLPGIIDAERRRFRTALEALAEQVLDPLSEWQAAESARIEKHNACIRSLQMLCVSLDDLNSFQIDARLDQAKYTFEDHDFEELGQYAKDQFENVCTVLQTAYLAATERERTAAETLALQEADQERLRIEREAQIAENARQEALRGSQATIEQLTAEKAELEAKLVAVVPAPPSEIDLQLLELQAEVDRGNAPQAVPAPTIDKKAHVIQAMTAAFIRAGLSETHAITAVRAITDGLIPNVEVIFS